jgi:putative aldouronate transport system permease protein
MTLTGTNKNHLLIKEKLYFLYNDINKNYELYLLSIPVFVYIVIFCYAPMYGVLIAFNDYSPTRGILGSPWVGFEHFHRFFRAYYFWTLLKNTLTISVYSLIVGFPCPIVFAIMLNELKHRYFKKSLQMVTYIPNFFSMVVMVGMLLIFISPKYGIINKIIDIFGIDPVLFISKPEWFKTLYVFSGTWQSMGWNAIIYIAALTNINQEIIEAAIIDGATKIKRIVYIDVPGIMPIAVILLILNMGGLMSVGFEKILLMQNPLNMVSSEVISTYVYRVGLLSNEYSFSTAVGLFNSVINFTLLVVFNQLARKASEISLW